MADIPSHARVVIIGGGAVGCSVAYHLTKMGWRDVVLLERNELASGSTWHAAGNCPNFSGSWSIMKMQNYATKLYAGLGAAVDYPMNYHVTGSVRLAHSDARMEEFRHVESMGRYQGIDLAMMSLAEMKDAYPFLELHDLKGGIWDPTDGDIDPSQLTQALAKGARDAGAKIIRFCSVTGISRIGDEWQIETDKGNIRCEKAVNAAGYRAHEIGSMVGRDVPCISLSHQYLVTDEIAELKGRDEKLPLLRDPDISYYLRQERDGLLLGPYEWQATTYWTSRSDPIPQDFSFQLWPDDLDRLEFYIDDACKRVPILGSVGVQKVINGPIPYAPDGNPLIGPAPGLENFYEACVFTFGIVQAGGAGKIAAEWIVEGETEWDMWSVDPRRFTDYATTAYNKAKAIDIYQNEYAIGFPFEERAAGRPAKTSPVYQRLKDKGAMFGARGGWERPVWFPRPGKDEAKEQLSFHRTNWFDAVAEECKAVQEAVGLLDLTTFARFDVRGEGAGAWLETLITGALPREGRISLAYCTTAKGRVLSEFTIMRLGPDHFWLLSAAGAEWHDRDLLRGHLPANSAIRVENISPQWGTLVLAGPKSREVLAGVCDLDLSNKAFAWLTHRPLEVGQARGYAVRVNYVGELGWELHLPIHMLLGVYDLLWEAGAPHGMRDFGMYAVESLRLEKCYRSWKQDLSTDYTPLGSELGRFVRLNKPDFVGKSAIVEEGRAGPGEKFVAMIVDTSDVDAPYLSTIWNEGERVGLVTSGGYGHRVERSIALGQVRPDLARVGTELEIEILGRRCPATVVRDPIYDPENARLRA